MAVMDRLKKFRTLLCLIVLISFLSSNVYSVISQKLFDADDYEYQMTLLLCSMAGVVGPSSAVPVTAHELEIALDRIDVNILSASELQYYSELRETITGEDEFDIDFTLDISPQVFIVDNYSWKEEDGGGRNAFFLPYNEERPFFEFGGGLSFGDNVYIEGYIPIKNSPLKDGMNITSLSWLFNFRNEQFNFMGAGNTGMIPEVPFKARGAFGNEWINLVIGRTPHSMGSGFTSNMMVSNNFDYQEVMKLGFTSNLFTYNIDITHFDRQVSLYDFELTSFDGKQQNRIVHRFDINILNKVRFVVNLGTLYYTDAAFDFRWLTPFMVAHNYFNYSENFYLPKNGVDEANNIFGIEIDWPFLPGFNLSVQFVLDQFQLFFEDADSLPLACGGLLNLSWRKMEKEYAVTFWGEFVYTTPFLYLNEKYDDLAGNNHNYNYDFIFGYHRREWAASSAAFSGYKYGPDTIAGTIGGVYSDFANKFNVSGSIGYRVHGEKGISNPTFSTESDSGFQAVTPTGQNPEHSIDFICEANWFILDNLDLFGGASFAYYWNYQNKNEDRFIPGAYIGITWSII